MQQKSGEIKGPSRRGDRIWEPLLPRENKARAPNRTPSRRRQGKPGRIGCRKKPHFPEENRFATPTCSRKGPHTLATKLRWSLFSRHFLRFEILSRSNRRRGAGWKITMELVFPTFLAIFVFQCSKAAPREFVLKRKMPRKQAPSQVLLACLATSSASKKGKTSEKQAPS